jgi:hypothetical protein
MKQAPQTQAPVAILRAEIEAWRTASRMSREAVAIVIVEAHEAGGADAATEILFDFGGDAFDRARKSAQKIFRWLDEGNLPANMIPSILAALPMERRLNCLGQMFCPMGIEVRHVGAGGDGSLDVAAHLPRVMKEAGEAQLALVHLPADASDADLLAAHKELTEAAQACENAARDAMAVIVARQTVARAAESASK